MSVAPTARRLAVAFPSLDSRPGRLVHGDHDRCQ